METFPLNGGNGTYSSVTHCTKSQTGPGIRFTEADNNSKLLNIETLA